MSIVMVGSTSGSITLQEPAVAGSNTISLPAATGTAVLTGVSGTVDINAAGSNNVTLSTNSTERVRVDSSGNVGIGTSSPATRLDVRCPSDVTQDIAYFSRPDALVRAKIALDGTGIINFGTSTNHPLAFLSNNSERMRITSGGDLLVGTSTGQASRIVTQADGTSTYGMTSNMTASSGTRYHIVFRESNTERGSVTSNGSATSYNTSSDYRLKENIAPMQNALGVVTQLKPVTYTWKSNGSAGQGFIAHELQAVVPDAVVGEKDAVDKDGNPLYQGMDTSFLVATLTAAIQEQQAMIEELKSKVAALEGTT